MEVTQETCVLHSALEFCNSQCNGGLVNFSEPSLNKDGADVDVFSTLTSSVKEIIGGLEFDHSEAQIKEWKIKMVSILTALAIREELSDLIDEETELYIMLEDYPMLNTNLLFKLLVACDMETAFINVLETLEKPIAMKLLNKCVDHFIAEGVTNKGRLLTCILLYTFHHDKGVLVSLAQDNYKPLCVGPFEKLFALLHDLMRTKEQVAATIEQASIVFSGILNMINLSLFSPLHLCDAMELLNLAQKKDLPTIGTNIAETNRYKLFHEKYSLTLGEYCAVMTQIQSEAASGKLQERRFPGVTLPVSLTEHCFQLLAYFLETPSCMSAVMEYVTFWKNESHVTLVDTREWQVSCILFASICKQIENIQSLHSIPRTRAQLKSTGKLDIIRIVQNKITSSVLNTLQDNDVANNHGFIKAVVVLGERLSGWEDSLEYLLSDSRWMGDKRWFLSLQNNGSSLCTTKQAVSLFERLVDLSRSSGFGKESLGAFRKLFLQVFEALPTEWQQDVLITAFGIETTDVTMETILGSDSTRVFGRLTVVLNRLIDVGEEIGDKIINQLALLSLQSPETVITHLLKHAWQNKRQCDVIVNVLRHLSALLVFRSRSDPNKTCLILAVHRTLSNVQTLSRKQQSALLCFITRCLASESSASKERNNDKSESIDNHEAKSLGDVPTAPLLKFTQVVSQCLVPLLVDSTTQNDDVNNICEERFVYYLRVLETIFEVHGGSFVDVDEWKMLNCISLLFSLVELLKTVKDMTMDMRNHLSLISDFVDLTVSIVEKLQTFITTNSHYLSIDDISWLLRITAARLPWYYKGLLLPFCRLVSKLAHQSTVHPDHLVLFLPTGFEAICSPSKLPNGVRIHKKFAFSGSVWKQFFQASAINDDIAEMLCGSLLEDLVSRGDSDDSVHLLNGLVETLLNASENEWLRISNALQALSHFVDPAVTLFAAFDIILCASSPEIKSYYVRAFAKALRCILDKHLQEAKLTEGRGCCEEIKKIFRYIAHTQNISKRLSTVELQEQMLAIYLSLVDNYGDLLAKYREDRKCRNAFSEGSVARLQRLVEKLEPAESRELVLRKIQECGLAVGEVKTRPEQ